MTEENQTPDLPDQESVAPSKSPDTIKGEYAEASGAANYLFKPEEMDIYVNKMTLETFVFHGKEVDYDSLEYMEYDHKACTVEVHKKDGTKIDLGVKIQWLIRPYWSKATDVYIVQTKDGKSVKGTSLPMKHKNKI